MRIIISPAKKMKTDTDCFAERQLPQFIQQSEIILDVLRQMDYPELKAMWKCNDAIAELNLERIKAMELTRNLTPAIFAYEGLQYQYMAPGILQTEELEYLQKHLRILSGFYGMLRPFDGVVPYRLEMQAKLAGPDFSSLYGFWNQQLADQLFAESGCIVNLASKEYSKCIAPYLREDIRMVTCVFGQETASGKITEKATFAKMARGEMVRFMAERQILQVEEIKEYNGFDFAYTEELSDESMYVFIQQKR